MNSDDFFIRFGALSYGLCRRGRFASELDPAYDADYRRNVEDLAHALLIEAEHPYQRRMIGWLFIGDPWRSNPELHRMLDEWEHRWQHNAQHFLGKDFEAAMTSYILAQAEPVSSIFIRLLATAIRDRGCDRCSVCGQTLKFHIVSTLTLGHPLPHVFVAGERSC